MAFGGFRQESQPAAMAEINMIPLIDVMLVLLVIFIITAPLLTHAVKIELPKASSQPNLTKPDHIALSIDAEGALFWNGERVDRRGLHERLLGHSQGAHHHRDRFAAARRAPHQRASAA